MVVGGRELIDTLWNVNDVKLQGTNAKETTELIDTLWNVNSISTALGGITHPELIDTLWNVNNPTCAIPIIA